MPLTAGAFDTDSAAVREAYLGELTTEKRQAAFDGLVELQDALIEIGGSGGSAAGGVIIISTNPVPPPPAPTINILSTISAASDADLAAFGDPLNLNAAELDVTADFVTARGITVGLDGALIDTNEHRLEVSGTVTANGLLRKDGEGVLRLTGNNVWNTSPFVNEGTVSGTTSSLMTDINSAVHPAFFNRPQVTIEFDQSFDGAYDFSINDGPVLPNQAQPDVNLVKRGTGVVTLSEYGRFGAGETHVAEGILALTGSGRVGGGTLTLDAGTTFDLSGSSLINLSVGELSGSGNLILGDLKLLSTANTNASFDGVISGVGSFHWGNSRSSGMPQLTLSKVQTYSGNTSLDDSVLKLSGDAALAASSAVELQRANLDISQANGNRLIAGLSGSGKVLLGSNDLALGSNNADSVFSGTFDGSGTVVKQGGGTLELLGNNEGLFAGAIKIEQGRIRAITRGLAATVINNSELELVQDNVGALPLTAYSGTISGTGQLYKSGDGVIWLRGENSYSGGTVIESGVLLGNTDSIQGDISNAGGVGFYQVNNGEYSGDVSGSGSLFAYGPGRLTLSGRNTHSGGTVFSNTLVATHSQALGAADSDVVLAGGTLELAGEISLLQRLAVAASGGTLNTRGFTFTSGRGLSGSGDLVKRGAGLFRLSGNNTAYTGTLNITDGAATLSGQLGGHLVLGPAVSLQVETSPSGSSKIALTGANSTLSVNAAKLAITAGDADYGNRAQFTIATASGGVNGSFSASSIDRDDLAAAVSVSGNEIVVAFASLAAPLSLFAGNDQQSSTAAALDRLFEPSLRAQDPSLQQAFDTFVLLSEDELPQALESVAGTSLAGTTRSIAQAQRALNQTLSQRLAIVAGGPQISVRVPASPLLAAAALGLSFDENQPATRHGAWLRGFGGSGEFEVSAGADDQRMQMGGLAAGYDYALRPDLTAGVLFVLSEATLRQDTPASRTNIDSWQLGLYARYRRDQLYLDGTVTYADHDVSTRRNLALGVNATDTRANFGGHTWNMRAESGYQFEFLPAAQLRLMPFFALQYSRQSFNAYSERGGGALALVVNNSSEVSVRSELGLRLARTWLSTGERELETYTYAAWAHEFTGQSNLAARYASAPVGLGFTIRGTNPARNAANFGAGFHFSGGENLRLFAGFDGEADRRQSTYGASIGLRFRF